MLSPNVLKTDVNMSKIFKLCGILVRIGSNLEPLVGEKFPESIAEPEAVEREMGRDRNGGRITGLFVVTRELSRDVCFVRAGSKLSQIGPKWDKSGAFSDPISVHLAPLRQMH